jgi:hypothetical protein
VVLNPVTVLLLLAMARSGVSAQQSSRSSILSPIDSYDYVIGTQSIGAAYQFTKETKLVETAQAIQAMGSNILKFNLDAEAGVDPKPRTLAEAAERDPSVRAVLEMPFACYLIWAYPLSATGGSGPFDPVRLDTERREIYDLTRYLLRTYKGTGKKFYLGNWEGDWMLTKVNPNYVASDQELQNMIAWVNTRQKAVDDARRDTPHSGVEVYYYVEVNLVQDARQGKVRVANKVLPFTNPDYVSYSSYDAQNGDVEKTYAGALDYLQSQLRPKPGIPGKRVFIGEYGLPAADFGAQAQDSMARHVMRAGLRWGCPFVLYWEMYNNEVTADGRQRGFWLIDDKGIKQPAYFTHQQFYAKARAYVAGYYARHKRVPTREEFGRAAIEWVPQPAP